MDRGPQGWAEAASSLAGNSEASSLVPGPGRQLFSGVCEPAASSGPHVVVTLSPLPSRATQNVTPQSWLWSRPCPAHLASQPRLGQVSSTQDQMCISHVGWAAGPSCLGECGVLQVRVGCSPLWGFSAHLLLALRWPSVQTCPGQLFWGWAAVSDEGPFLAWAWE